MMKPSEITLLIAPNAFKHSLDASQVAQAIAEGLTESGLNGKWTCFPIGDGGDGTIDLILDHLKGERLSKIVKGPLGKPVEASYGLIDGGKVALIEMADAAGIKLLQEHERDPMRASSFGAGELLAHALDRGVERLVIGMGGSATVDGGCGILAALGARFFDDKGNLLEPCPKALKKLAKIDLGQLHKRLKEVKVTILCDVENKLLGPQGAAAVFGPQKGTGNEEVKALEGFLSHLSTQLKQVTGRDMADVVSGGVAGGAAGGLYAALGAQLVGGIDHFMASTGFEQVLAKADVLITGEGSLDSQTLGGKGPFGVAMKAKERNIPVIAVAGRVPLVDDKAMRQAFDVLLPIGNEPMVLEEALAHTRENLVRTGTTIGNFLKINGFPISKG